MSLNYFPSFHPIHGCVHDTQDTYYYVRTHLLLLIPNALLLNNAKHEVDRQCSVLGTGGVEHLSAMNISRRSDSRWIGIRRTNTLF